MRRSGNKVLMIVLIVIALLLIVGGVFAYIFFATDTFKSGQELFAKYLMQNVEELSETISLEKVEQLGEKIKQNKYEETITISCDNSEGTNLVDRITLDTQNDPINKKYYGILGIENSNFEENLNLEYMIENDMYSLRFTNAVKQFLTIKNTNLKEFARKFGMDELTIEQIPDTIDFETFSLEKINFTDEEIELELNKYANLLYNNILKEKYEKNKNTVITLNGKTITTNSYTLTLSMLDTKNLVIKFLEELKQDEIILDKLQAIDEMLEEYVEINLKDSFIKEIEEGIDIISKKEITEEENIVITVYEEKGKTVRIKAEKGFSYITMDTIKIDGKAQIDLNYTNIDEENTQLGNKITFIKESNNKLKIQITNIEGEEQENVEYHIETVEEDNNIKVNITMSSGDVILHINRNINLVNDIQYNVELDSSNNIILNELDAEKMTSIFGLLGPKIIEEYIEPISKLLSTNMNFDSITNNNLSEAEINQFNGKFTVYEGEGVSPAEVNSLLNVIFSHNDTEKLRPNIQYYVRISGKISMDENTTSLPTIEGTNNYNIECKFDENGLVNEIVITEGEIDLEDVGTNDVEATDNISDTAGNIIGMLETLN